MITLFIVTHAALTASLYALVTRYQRDKLIMLSAALGSVFIGVMTTGDTGVAWHGQAAALLTLCLAILYVKASGSGEKALWTHQIANRMSDVRDILEAQKEITCAVLVSAGEEQRQDYYLRGLIDGLIDRRESVPTEHVAAYRLGLEQASIESLRAHINR